MKPEDRSVVRRSAPPASKTTPLVTPLFPSVVYCAEDADALDDVYEGRASGYSYAREGHPNASLLADKISWMEGVEGGIITASGMAALSAVFLALLDKGDHIVAGNQLYGRCLRLLTKDLPRLGFDASLVDAADVSAVEAALRPETKLLLVEVVANPTLRLADIKGLAKLARQRGLIFVVDNTFTTPRSFRPFDLGADVVVHSVTKLLAGHSDVTLGYVAAKDEARNTALYDAVTTWGLNASPFDCWLAERGLNTFDLRFQRAQENAKALADHLRGLPGVLRVLYPGEDDHPDRALARDLLQGNYSHMVSFELDADRAGVNAFVRAAGNIAFAPTLGDVGTTISHPASSSHRALSAEERAALGISEGFIRVSVGVEEIDLLKRELTAAVAAASAAKA
ncbi:aminotransferase class I/II-fold pyridoxal phosphate-dependent enzyme [Pelagibius litoralis]|uniref:Aminotransferase class I/II-fold pyridoxal phosphate-dependent enzyme n=1 Tax=Pelagibius litoralis TaxID=374515 RepID=A0A967EYY7_9PROT|nr:aminotransferase class I/II-fold pyridoxal phosphate-dependent enzyme [Pelagibius litoralis]NIA69996.1 aminotransferase class I/II-fold pyridoxal phosphate-dependent enzyme [Pelagibius litoralis]